MARRRRTTSRCEFALRIPDDLGAEWILGDPATGLDLYEHDRAEGENGERCAASSGGTGMLEAGSIRTVRTVNPLRDFTGRPGGSSVAAAARRSETTAAHVCMRRNESVLSPRSGRRD